MSFPVEFPLYNDKVILRVWDKRTMVSDIFIANIPEFTKENDFFSLTYLQSRGGIMPFRWVYKNYIKPILIIIYFNIFSLIYMVFLQMKETQTS